jgi:hypothetical protein
MPSREVSRLGIRCAPFPVLREDAVGYLPATAVSQVLPFGTPMPVTSS